MPRWWLALPLVVLWANLHGGWILAPATLALVALGRLLDHGIRDRLARRAALLRSASMSHGLKQGPRMAAHFSWSSVMIVFATPTVWFVAFTRRTSARRSPCPG